MYDARHMKRTCTRTICSPHDRPLHVGCFLEGRSRNFLEEAAPIDCPRLSVGTSPMLLTLTLRAQIYHGDIVAGVAAGKMLRCGYAIQGSIRNTAVDQVCSLYDLDDPGVNVRPVPAKIGLHSFGQWLQTPERG